jgi:hypothetical protein
MPAWRRGVEVDEWEIFFTDEVGEFLDDLFESDRETHKLVNQAILVLEHNGRDPHLVCLRSVAGGDSVGRGRQVGQLGAVVPAGDSPSGKRQQEAGS